MIKKVNLDASLVNYIDNLGMGVESRGAIGGTVYYVEGNSGRDSWDGLTIDTAFKTLAKAISVSNTNMGQRSRWARRNTIYLAADVTTEDLVAFPNKCDVVGIGSYDANTKPGITGHHVPVNAENYGTRFINVWFKGKAVAAPIVTLASTTSGAQFIGCTFSAAVTGTCSTIGIQATASPFLKVIGCRFEGPFSTSDITFGTGEAGGTEIVDNIMQDAAAGGIIIGSGATASWRGLVKDNFVQAVGKVIDTQATSVFNVIGNRFVSAAAVGASSYVIDLTYACNNWLTGNDVMVPIPTYVNADS